MLTRSSYIFFHVVLALLLFFSTNAHSAFCSLRDPVSAIQHMYGNDYQYRSVVASVTEQDREALKQRLPFTIHQSEVGKHTLYVLFKENEPFNHGVYRGQKIYKIYKRV